MATKFSHLAWLNKTKEALTSSDGKPIDVYELIVDSADTNTWKSWANHIRKHYCIDSMIDEYRSGTKYSRVEAVRHMILPDAKEGFGPAVRAGDFIEILLSDFLEHKYSCFVPRVRYGDKFTRNESTKGVDVLGVKFANADLTPSPADTLVTIECKSQLTGKKPIAILQNAVIASSKDAIHKAETLFAIKRRLINKNKRKSAEKIERFQDPLGNPYKETTGAAAAYTTTVFDKNVIQKTTDCASHNNLSNLILIVIKADDFMNMVHRLYESAADEAK